MFDVLQRLGGSAFARAREEREVVEPVGMYKRYDPTPAQITFPWYVSVRKVVPEVGWITEDPVESNAHLLQIATGLPISRAGRTAVAQTNDSPYLPKP